MIERLVERLATVVANRVVEEIFERLPTVTDLMTTVLPLVAERVTEELLDRLPFPFNK